MESPFPSYRAGSGPGERGLIIGRIDLITIRRLATNASRSS